MALTLPHTLAPSRRWLQAVLLLGVLALTVPPAAARGGTPDPRVRWRYQLQGTSTANYVVVSPTGTVYVNNNRRLVALDPSGNLQWEVPNTSQRLAHPISLDADGTLYVGGLGLGQVTALNPDGSLKWAYTPPANSRLLSGPTQGPDGNIYAIAENFGTYSLDPTGALLWIGDMELSNNPNSSPLLFDSKRFFAAIAHNSPGKILHAYDVTDGRETWSNATVGIPWGGAPSMDLSGRIIGRRWDNWVQALQPATGKTDWFTKHAGNGLFLGRPVVGPDGAIYAGDIFGVELWSLDANGNTRWVMPAESGSVLKLSVAPDNSVLVADGQDGIGWLRGYDPADGTVLWQVDLDAENSLNQYISGWEAAFSPDNLTAYVATNFAGGANNYGYLYAVALDDEIGVPFCLGDGAAGACPCGNTSNAGGCANSTGVGAELLGSGSTSIAADDLVLTASSVPAKVFGVPFMAAGQKSGAPFGNGLLCLAPPFYRFKVVQADISGVATIGPGLVAQSLGNPVAGQIMVGATWGFQYWYRDPGGPCGAKFNTTNGLSVTFVP